MLPNWMLNQIIYGKDTLQKSSMRTNLRDVPAWLFDKELDQCGGRSMGEKGANMLGGCAESSRPAWWTT